MKNATIDSPRYVVRATGTEKRPFEVHDTKGTPSGLGWVVFCSANYQSALNRAMLLNREGHRA